MAEVPEGSAPVDTVEEKTLEKHESQSEADTSDKDTKQSSPGDGEEKDTAESEAAPVESLRCVKVFELDTDGKWSDKGTGVVECVYVEPKEAMCLVVRSDRDNTVLMNSTIRNGVNYVRQQDTLIVWTEPNGQDLALSFQAAAGCTNLWDELDRIKERQAADKHDIDQLPNTHEHDEEATTEDYQGPRELDLPDPELANLKYLEELVFRAARSVFGRDLLLQAVERTNFIRKLLPVFETSEDLEDMESLYALSSILRSLIFLNEGTIFELILSDELFTSVLGILEYDREFPNMKAEHREHFAKHAQFKQIVPIRNSEIRAKINQTYRVQYLKDVALARLLDDGTFSALLSMTFFNQTEIIQYIRQDPTFLKDVFGLLMAPETPQEKKGDAIMFLHELCSITKNLQSMNRGLFFRHCDPDAFYRTLINHGLFNVLSTTFSNEDVRVRTAMTAITAHLLEHDANIVRTMTQAQVKAADGPPFIEMLIDRLLEESDAGLRSQYAEMIRILLDTAPLDTSEGIVPHLPSSEHAVDNFLQLFYDNWVAKLVKPVLQLNTEGHMKARPDGLEIFELDPDQAAVCNHICELLCFMIKQHPVRCPYLFTTTDIASKVALLLRSKETYLRLSALRVFRVCIGMKDVFWHRLLIKKDIFKNVLTAFFETKSKYNLLNSACLELFEFIRKENLKPLVAHVVTNYRKQIEEVDYVDTFKALILRYEQNIEPQPNGGESSEEPTHDKQKARDGWNRTDDAEEAYFNTSDEDEDGNSSGTVVNGNSTRDKKTSSSKLSPRRGNIEFVRASPDLLPPRPLVDYPDDDDDDVIGALATKGKTGSPTASSKLSSKVSPVVSAPVKINFTLGGPRREKRTRDDEEMAKGQATKKEKVADVIVETTADANESATAGREEKKSNGKPGALKENAGAEKTLALVHERGDPETKVESEAGLSNGEGTATPPTVNSTGRNATSKEKG
ncbi:uncharacterized protein SPPG_02678 [Spizellomyces punctatus DAOM BR117]|uniref:Uncharacterized protein n=1 Tax=Spizellomyces punctatus (strain DAOM BR117) TaxID=645134 RepID=A0A0L0HL80_SPIPD|nr:hypothetical protein, variant [Spizellomyces punctatus DAOM BR117]XP_016610230.1 uncharacterized protein SPPG_02678 [Spizellomyces punctatus DAOM BR117]KND02190.1 hypothetical protein, variant [Spizellomyces punctatus DAOM BR117]KND02191.1 hypothetical protein SPPG_02678 [Spizellomyces punctatus DAOM BR117]|eukprot:XP_016610229.1 hypothetical protein, variant [Spizellomyces punctatus DAOM BR117]